MKRSLEDAMLIVQSNPAAYVIQSSEEDFLYKGSCRDLKKRLKDHKAGRVSRTKNRRPLQLVYFEMFDSFSEARKRENFFKTGAGRQFIANQIQEKDASS